MGGESPGTTCTWSIEGSVCNIRLGESKSMTGLVVRFADIRVPPGTIERNVYLVFGVYFHGTLLNGVSVSAGVHSCRCFREKQSLLAETYPSGSSASRHALIFPARWHQVIDLYDLIFDAYGGSSPDFPFAQAQSVSGDGSTSNHGLPSVTGFVDTDPVPSQSRVYR